MALRSTIVSIVSFWVLGVVDGWRADRLDMFAIWSPLGFVMNKLLSFVSIHRSEARSRQLPFHVTSPTPGGHRGCRGENGTSGFPGVSFFSLDMVAAAWCGLFGCG